MLFLSRLSPARIVAAATLLAFSTLPALAEMAAPTGEPILAVDGSITTTNVDTTASFDLDMLMALPAATYETTTNWTDGKRSFTGVPLKTLLDSLGADGTKIVATALNNYSVEIPMDTITDEAPIVAYHIDGETFSRRDKGPLWIVYPYDSSEEYRTELVFWWSIWLLAKLSIVK
jgi:hypothetical protein